MKTSKRTKLIINRCVALVLFLAMIFQSCASKDVRKEDETNSRKFSDPRMEILHKRILNNPKDADAMAQLGYLYGQSGDIVTEIAYYEKALDIKPDFKEVHYNLACVYASNGEKTRAIRYLSHALKYGFRSRKAIESDKDLDNIRQEPDYKRLMKQYFG